MSTSGQSNLPRVSVARAQESLKHLHLENVSINQCLFQHLATYNSPPQMAAKLCALKNFLAETMSYKYMTETVF